MTNHEKLVRRIAEEMAKVQYNDLFAIFEILFSELTTDQKEMMIVRTLPAARIAVKHIADSFDEGFQLGFEYDAESKTLYEEMMQRGLLPAKEDGSNE